MESTELTQIRLKEVLEYNPETGKFLWKRSTPMGKKGWFKGSLGGTGDLYIRVDGKLYKAHRLALLYTDGEFPSDVVDHINGERDDNRRRNIRVCTQSQNLYNTRLPTTNTSGHKGVSWKKGRETWQVRIGVDKVYKTFGCYKDFELACLVANEVRNKYHREFANHG
jgi:hypothetical protein